MELCLKFSVFALFVCMMVPCLVYGDCSITKPPKCDLMYPEVVTNISFNGTCSDKDTAYITIGNTYELNFTFTPVEDAENALCAVVVELPFGILIPVNLSSPDACESMGLTCPLKKDTEYTVHNVFTVEKFPVYTDLSATVHWALVDQQPSAFNGEYDYSKEIFCVRVDALVKPEPTPTPPSVQEEEPIFRVVH